MIDQTATWTTPQTVSEVTEQTPLSMGHVGQPMSGTGYVWAQIGWLDVATGSVHELAVPPAATRRPLYVCLGRHHQDPEMCG